MLRLWRHRRACLDARDVARRAATMLALWALMNTVNNPEFADRLAAAARRHSQRADRLGRWWAVPYDSPDLRPLEESR